MTDRADSGGPVAGGGESAPPLAGGADCTAQETSAAARPAGPAAKGIGRRHVITASALGLGVGLGAGALAGRAADQPEPAQLDTTGLGGRATEPFYGEHQAGVETVPQAHARFVALTLRPGRKADQVVRLLRLLSDDAAALAAGRGPLADSERELAVRPARLTVTFGFGRRLVALAGKDKVPEWLTDLPAFPIDRLDKRLSTGDLLLQVCSDDPQTLAHATRMLLKDARSFARIAWTQSAARRAYGSDPKGTTMRNSFGQVDGTANPKPGSEDFARLVWGVADPKATQFSKRGAPPHDLAADFPAWMRGGTTLVLRDIAMNLATWDEADRPGREFSVGRKLSDGAPLTGSAEHDEPDFKATDKLGLSVISPVSHIARSRGDAPKAAEQIFRRVYGYQEVVSGGGVHVQRSIGATTADERHVQDIEFDRAGLMFASFQASIGRQFLPIQRRLAKVDLLNQWTTPIGSTVWAIPPGASGTGHYVGQTLFEG